MNLEKLLTRLYEAQKMKGTNALNEIMEAIDAHLTGASSEYDSLMADLEWYRSGNKEDDAA
ncbi:hypothetical protein [Cohnella nanjingensis]|uniref:Uncharacterized protein n=1 Tax=Cohnella nanjingensis TaxID=1387779 RepID=A0A7X0VG02_9BACL|nr:hypothetical protein [Cohnella nanjingensis]MBB6672592.1 hypothetical protein [Cohnella nanjingensis]